MDYWKNDIVIISVIIIIIMSFKIFMMKMEGS